MASSELPPARQANPGDPVEPREVRIVGGVSLQARESRDTPDLAFWSQLRTSSERLSFETYQTFINDAFCKLAGEGASALGRARGVSAALPFPDIKSYRALKSATEIFMELACGVHVRDVDLGDWNDAYARDKGRLGLEADEKNGPKVLESLWDEYVDHPKDEMDQVIPYLIAVRGNLSGTSFRPDLRDRQQVKDVELCEFLLMEKFKRPCFIELIWSYWHEEGMLVRSMDAISRRFQNQGARNGREPLAELEITPLRPLNNLLWGYIQDEQHRLTPQRRLYEYDHHYGLRPVRDLRTAESRSRFLDALHVLIQKCAAFFKEEDDTTVVADAFPILNALRDVHLLLAEGAHNQFGDLPWTSRTEMLMEQWLLARPEFDEFLPSRAAVVFPEAWMHRVEAMKRLHRWEQPSVRHFNTLARVGELLLLSIRYGNWGVVDDVDNARNWARFFRSDLSWYSYSYQAVTGVDLTSGMVDVRQAAPPLNRNAQPSALMRSRAPRGALGPAPVRQPMRRPARRELRP
jgi:hypothetical protein